MGEALPIFPLATVLFPGVSLPLHIFEERYRHLVGDLLQRPEGTARTFGVVAIREGYEVGTRGVQSVQRLGCAAQMTSARRYDDGRYDIEVVGRRRLRVDAVDTSGDYLVGEVEWLQETRGADAPREAARAWQAFEAYRTRLAGLRGRAVVEGPPDRDPVRLSYQLASTCLLTQPDRQRLLEVDDAAERLRLITSLLRTELRSMTAVPSFPATEVARTGWSPN
ncbi:MAG: LON peptidase substrate-binding domain-containing protein [Actinomycetota bacterium]|nr:LON peptidase substrate-binding domain-containing protein [Actinomycetota bacterium]